MKNKLKEVSESIQSGLSFDDYTPSTHNTIKTESGNSGITPKHKAIKKVKRTFYIQEGIADQLDALYAKLIIDKKKVDKSDIVSKALVNLFENKEKDIQSF